MNPSSGPASSSSTPASASASPSSAPAPAPAPATTGAASGQSAWTYVQSLVPEYRNATEFRGQGPQGVYAVLGNLPSVNNITLNPQRPLREREAGQIFNLGRSSGRSRFNNNLKAILVQAAGQAATTQAAACDKCRESKGLWQGCVRAPASHPDVLPHGACANCAYNSHAKLCITSPVVAYMPPAPAPSVAVQPAQGTASLSSGTTAAPIPETEAEPAAASVAEAGEDSAVDDRMSSLSLEDAVGLPSSHPSAQEGSPDDGGDNVVLEPRRAQSEELGEAGGYEDNDKELAEEEESARQSQKTPQKANEGSSQSHLSSSSTPRQIKITPLKRTYRLRDDGLGDGQEDLDDDGDREQQQRSKAVWQRKSKGLDLTQFKRDVRAGRSQSRPGTTEGVGSSSSPPKRFWPNLAEELRAEEGLDEEKFLDLDFPESPKSTPARKINRQRKKKATAPP